MRIEEVTNIVGNWMHGAVTEVEEEMGQEKGSFQVIYRAILQKTVEMVEQMYGKDSIEFRIANANWHAYKETVQDAQKQGY